MNRRMEATTLLWIQDCHRASKIQNMGQPPIIISYCHSMPAPHPLIESLLAHTGFADEAKLRHFKIDHHLVTALVERWRPEMHTFHLPVGECTITLEDVALQLGIRVDGRPITGATYCDWKEMCEQYLGVVPPKGEAIVGSAIKLKWLQDNMLSFPAEPTQQWSGGGFSFTGTPHGDVISYRMRLDHMTAEQFLWNPYLHFLDALESTAFVDSSIWTTCTSLICFSIVEWHQTDIVKLQFRL
ncbi:Serine/threonine-protein phosphatase 7 long form [Glycine soja]